MSGSDDPIPPNRYATVNLVEMLSVAQDLPAEAIALALMNPARVADAVLAVVARAAGGEALAEREQNLLFWGIHILAGARDVRLFRPLLALLRRPGDAVPELLGEAVAGTLPRVVATAFDGDADALEAAIADREADEFVRWSLFGALALLTADGRIARERTAAFLARFADARPARAGDAAWTGWEQAIALLGLADLAPAVQAARDDARLLDDVSDPDWFALTLADATARPHDRARFHDLDLGYADDVVEELRQVLSADVEPYDPPEPVRNPWRDVGRNDPCPCGSGLKHKKCCLAAAPGA